ncbi:MAG: S-layer homology domain-containing protein [Clostridiales bacterium]|jgi:hypothetical protein|nr:S-layer homology domain-containing protein [Clostridiales bacterium]
MKKILANVILASIIFAAMPATEVKAAQSGFNDVSGHWAEKLIEKYTALGIVSGYPDGSFRPDKPCTRAETVVMYNKFFHVELLGAAHFSDVNADDWFVGDVGAAISKKYISGYPDGSFKPNQNTTRLQAFCMVYKLIGSPDPVDESILAKFADEMDIPDDQPIYREAASYLVSRGIVSAYSDFTLRVKNDITRAEQLSLLEMASKALEEKEEALASSKPEAAPTIAPITLPAEIEPSEETADEASNSEEAAEQSPTPPVANENAAPDESMTADEDESQEDPSPSDASRSRYSSGFRSESPYGGQFSNDSKSAHGRRGWPAPAKPDYGKGSFFYLKPDSSKAPAASQAPEEEILAEDDILADETAEIGLADQPEEIQATEQQTEILRTEQAAEAEENPSEQLETAQLQETEKPDNESKESRNLEVRLKSDAGTVVLEEDYTLKEDIVIKSGTTLLLANNACLTIPRGRKAVVQDGGGLSGSENGKLMLEAGGELDVVNSRLNLFETGIFYEFETGCTVRRGKTIFICSDKNAHITMLEGKLRLQNRKYILKDSEISLNKDLKLLPGESLEFLGTSLITVKSNLHFCEGATISGATRDSNIIVHGKGSITGLPSSYDFTNVGVYYYNIRDGVWIQIK